MYKKLYETQNGDYDLPSLLCVSAHAYNFMMDSVMGDTVDPDLEHIMSRQCQAYLTTARAALSQLSLLAAPSLVNLQAICHGVSCHLCLTCANDIDHETGYHFSGGRRSGICMDTYGYAIYPPCIILPHGT